ncbi:MAG: hypothetical protein NVS2B16_12860 [Chloroflexota bacterium]
MQSDVNRILIIEDEDDLAHLMRSVLEDEGYHVLVHSTGDCIDIIRAFQPDVVITDYMLPMCDGRAVVTRIRNEVSQDLPCILVSAMPQSCTEWRAWGATDFLAKPFDLDSLILAVHRAAGDASRAYAALYSDQYREQA